MSIPSAPRQIGGHRGKHSRGRGEPWRLPIVIPALLLVACVVGVVTYALSGGFTTHSANDAATSSSTSTTVAALPTLPASSTSPPSSSIAAKRVSTTTAPTTTAPTTTSSTTTTTSTTLPPATTIPANQVLVEVENGNGQPGQATQVSNALTSAGFEVNGIANATNYSYRASEILYSAGSATAAATLAAAVEGEVTTSEMPGIPKGEVYFIVGADYEGIR